MISGLFSGKSLLEVRFYLLAHLLKGTVIFIVISLSCNLEFPVQSKERDFYEVLRVVVTVSIFVDNLVFCT